MQGELSLCDTPPACIYSTRNGRHVLGILLHDVKAGALFLVILGNGILDILFSEGSRTPGMDGCQLIAVR